MAKDETENVPVISSAIVLYGMLIRGEWSGGQYIDLSFPGDSHPFTVINVWDSETDTASIRKNRIALRSAMQEWGRDITKDDLMNYLMNTKRD